MDTLRIGEDRFSLASKWPEVSLKEYREIAPWIMIDTSANRTIVMLKLAGKKQRKSLESALKQVIEVHDQDSNVAWQILSILDWAYHTRKVDLKSKNPGEREVAPLIPDFRYKGALYLLPKKNLMDITINEWAYIDAYLLGFSNGRNEYLQKLVATICRPQKSKKQLISNDFDGFPRIRFNPENVDLRAEQLKDVPVYVKHAVLDYVIRAGQYLKARYGIMFKGKASKGPSYRWEGTITQLAESGVFGTEIQVREALIHKCCRYLSQKLVDAKKRKENDS